MKKFFLITFIVAFIFPQSVFAEDGVYLKGSAGFFWLEDSNIELNPDGAGFDVGEFQYDVGFGLSTAIGKSFNNFDLELEYAYKKAKVDRFSAEEVNLNGLILQLPDADLDSSVKIHSLMTNAIYNFRNTSAITPYVGAGMGVAWVDVEELSDKEFAYQALAGVALSVSKNTSITAAYRYFATKDISDNAINDVKGIIPIESHNFELGLRFSF